MTHAPFDDRIETNEAVYLLDCHALAGFAGGCCDCYDLLTAIMVVGVNPLQLRRTMRCNGAGLARFHEWKVNSPGPLIAVVLLFKELKQT